jgi:hypothetical protein
LRTGVSAFAEQPARDPGTAGRADRSYHEGRRRFVYELGSPCAV